MKRINNKVKIFIILLLLVVSFSVTYAYYTSSGTFQNEFFVGDFYVIIEEEYDDSYVGTSNNLDNSQFSKKVYVSNKEETDAIVRISYNEYIELDKYSDLDYVYATNNLVNNTNLFVKNWVSTFSTDWIYLDGWYYYKKVLPASSFVQVLDGVTYTGENLVNYEGLYNLDFNLEALQATEDAVLDLWGKNVDINEDGTLSWSFDS